MKDCPNCAGYIKEIHLRGETVVELQRAIKAILDEADKPETKRMVERLKARMVADLNGLSLPLGIWDEDAVSPSSPPKG